MPQILKTLLLALSVALTSLPASASIRTWDFAFDTPVITDPLYALMAAVFAPDLPDKDLGPTVTGTIILDTDTSGATCGPNVCQYLASHYTLEGEFASLGWDALPLLAVRHGAGGSHGTGALLGLIRAKVTGDKLSNDLSLGVAAGLVVVACEPLIFDGCNVGPNGDNISLSDLHLTFTERTPVSEPGAALLAGVALLTLAFGRRRQAAR